MRKRKNIYRVAGRIYIEVRANTAEEALLLAQAKGFGVQQAGVDVFVTDDATVRNLSEERK